MSRTKVQVQIDTDCHELIPNAPISKLVLKNLKKVGRPRFDKPTRTWPASCRPRIRRLRLKETKPPARYDRRIPEVALSRRRLD